MTKIVLHLPFPPSVNELWRSNRGRVHISKKYKEWRNTAYWEMRLLMTDPKFNLDKNIPGAFKADLLLSKAHRGQKDADNRMKAALDFCKAHGLIKDDKFCDIGTFRWGDPEQAPLGARLILRKC